MNNKKTTRRALFSSIMALLLCCSMLVGTTFAWFTDSVTSTGNIIKSGTLAVEMYWKDATATGKQTTYKDASTGPIFNYDLWEPGYTDAKLVKIKNIGDLAFKYQLNIVPSVQPEAGKPNLADVIDAYLVPVANEENFKIDRNAADAIINGTTGTALSALIAEPDGAAHGVMLPVNSASMEGADIGEATYCIILHMRESATNEYQTLSVGNGFSVKLLAAQMTYEGDSFDELYDKDAEYDSWNAAADSDWYNTTDTEFTLTSAEQLAGLAELVNGGTDTFAGKTVKLGADIDLNDISWTPIGISGKAFNGTFIGTGYTISNLSVTGKAGVGLFGYVGNAAHIEGVTIDGAYVSGNDYVGAVVGRGYLAANCLKNCTVKNAEIVAMPYLTDDGKTYDGGAKAGAVAGYASNGNITGNKAINCSVTAYRDLGGIVGMAQPEDRNITVSGNSVEGVTLTYVRALPYDANTVNQNMDHFVGRDDPYRDFNVIVEDNSGEATFVQEPVTCVASAEGLATALTENEKNIHVVLARDIDVPITSLGDQTPSSGEYKLGGENTERITIDLNGNKLNITTTYWSAIGAKNDNAVFTIKNGSMTSTGNSAGTWNAYDVRFCNCDYVIENVTFDKAIALDAVDATLENVTINETHDYYAMWITAEGQTVTIDGLTVNSDGRGIKIDEQYVGTPEKVTLNVSNATFKTEKKAAIMVKSAAGANITLNNVDITKVADDPFRAVWVDEDAAAYADLVIVTGGKKANEANVGFATMDGVRYGTVADAVEAAGENAVINLGNKTVDEDEAIMPAAGQTLTIENGTITAPGAGIENFGTATLSNITMNAGSPADYSNISREGSVTTYEDVKVDSAGGGIGAVDGGKVVFNTGSVAVNSASTSGRYIFYAVGEGTEITINDGEFSFSKTQNQKRAYIYAGAGATVYVNGGTFGPASTRSGYTAGILGDGTVIIKGGTFGFDPSNWVAEGYQAVKNGSTWTVSANNP